MNQDSPFRGVARVRSITGLDVPRSLSDEGWMPRGSVDRHAHRQLRDDPKLQRWAQGDIKNRPALPAGGAGVRPWPVGEAPPDDAQVAAVVAAMQLG